MKHLWLLVSLLILFSLPARAAIRLSENQLRQLAYELAPKVNLFKSVWQIAPEAQFYAGTARDFLYWILKETEDSKDETELQAKISSLQELPFIDIREIVGPDSDIDLILDDHQSLPLKPEDFGIRKFDVILTSKVDPKTEEGRTEIDQGFIPAEKLRLSSSGIIHQPEFGNAVLEMLEGKLSVHFADEVVFWKTAYAESFSNHPALLALRYIRLIGQAYYNRFGEEKPTEEKLKSLLSDATRIQLKNIFQKALEDPKFDAFIHNKRGLKWWNAVLVKSVRSYTNPLVAKQLMEELGVENLSSAFPDRIQSIHQFMFRKTWDIKAADQNIRELGFDPYNIFIKPELKLKGRNLYHGTNDLTAYRSILFQGILASENGNGGHGAYAVPESHKHFAVSWARKRGDSRLVVELKIKKEARLIDISEGPGKLLLEKWKENNLNKLFSDTNLHDEFANAFAVDILRYPYRLAEAYVIKNSDAIESREGLLLKLKSLSELYNLSETVKSMEDLEDFIQLILFNSPRSDEIEILISRLPQTSFEELISNPIRLQNLFQDLFELHPMSSSQMSLRLISVIEKRFTHPKISRESLLNILAKSIHSIPLNAFKRVDWGPVSLNPNESFSLLHSLMTKDQQIVFAKVHARKRPYDAAILLERFPIASEKERYQIALIIAKVEGNAFFENFKRFGLTNEDWIFEVAERAAQTSHRAALSRAIPSLKLKDPMKRFKLIKLASALRASDGSKAWKENCPQSLQMILRKRR